MTNREHQSTIFKKAAKEGNVPDKDAVQEALDDIPNCYSALGCRNEGERVADLRWKEFYNANSQNQVIIGSKIITHYRDLIKGIDVFKNGGANSDKD